MQEEFAYDWMSAIAMIVISVGSLLSLVFFMSNVTNVIRHCAEKICCQKGDTILTLCWTVSVYNQENMYE